MSSNWSWRSSTLNSKSEWSATEPDPPLDSGLPKDMFNQGGVPPKESEGPAFGFGLITMIDKEKNR